MRDTSQGQFGREVTAQEIVESVAPLIEGSKRYAESGDALLEQLHALENAKGKLASTEKEAREIKSLRERISALFHGKK